MPRLRLVEKQEGKAPVSTGTHMVKLIDSKIIKGTDFSGKEIYQVKLFVEEDNEKKYYLFPLKDKQGEPHYLVQRLAEFEEGTEVIMEYKRKQGSTKGYIEVISANETGDEDEISIDNIPIIGDEDITGDIEEVSPDKNIKDDPEPF